MKKLRYFLVIALLLAVSTACGQEESGSTSTSGMASVEDVISAEMALEDNGSENETDATEQTTSESEADGTAADSEQDESDALVADVDLSGLSSTMIYAEIYSMVTTPLVYHGKTIKITGFYDEYYDVMTDTLYCSVFVLDALACCAQGLEVQFSSDYAYPDDYPTDGDEITIYATFEIYYPDPDSTAFYYHLVDAQLIA